MKAEKRIDETRRMAGSIGMRVYRGTARKREALQYRTPPAGCRPIASALEARPATAEAAPIWFAALAATRCQASASGGESAVRFEYIGGRAIYTNTSGSIENIAPLGVALEGGDTLAVYWTPGETAYTVEVLGQDHSGCAWIS